MIYRLKMDPKFPMFSEHTPVKTFKRRWVQDDGSVSWMFGGTDTNRAPLYEKRDRPKRMKKLIRTVKRTGGKIVSVRSEFQGKTWTKIIEVAQAPTARRHHAG